MVRTVRGTNWERVKCVSDKIHLEASKKWPYYAIKSKGWRFWV